MKYLVPLLLLFPGLVLAQSEKRFQLLSPAETGIHFENTLTDETAHNVLIYSNYYGGAGVGVGDFNRDGLQDVFFAGNLVADRLYLNQGNLQFEDISAQAGIRDDGGWSSGVIVADVNQDGWPDIYLTRELYDDKPLLRANLLYLNNGDLTFTEQAAQWGIADTARTRHATFLDYDQDQDLDLFLLNQPPNPGNYSELYGADFSQEAWRPRLYRNEGSHFTDVSAEAHVLDPGFANAVSTGDFNNDGWVDIYLANDFEQPDRLYLNQQDGTFQNVLNESMPHISFYSMGVDAADLNHDGWLDLMTLDMVAEDNFRLKANMSGMNPKAFWKVVKEGGHYQYMFNALHLNQGNLGPSGLHFSEIGHFAGVQSTDWSWSNLFADLDNDGYQDLYVTNGLLRDIRNTDATKKFTSYIEQVANDYVRSHPNAGDISIWDILDVEKALSLVPSVPLPNYAYRNNGDLTFSKTTEDWGLQYASFSNGSAYADLDNDGDLDLLINNVNAPAFLFQNQSRQLDKGHYLRIQPQSDAPLFGTRAWVKYGTEQQMQELTNVRGMYSTSEQIFHFGLGDYTGTVDLTLRWPNGNTQHFEAVTVDQVLEVQPETAVAPLEPKPAVTPLFADITAQSQLSHQHQENEFDDYFLQVLLPHKMSQWGPALATADVNGDGREDLFVGGALFRPGALYLQSPNGTFQANSPADFQADSKYEDVGACFFDADQDGDPDLYVVSGGNEFPEGDPGYQDRLYLNDGKGKFTRHSGLPTLTGSGSRVIPADFDKDGDLDLFVGGRHVPGAYPTPATSYLLRNDSRAGGKVQFTVVNNALIPGLNQLGMVTDAIWTDYNQDRQLDLVVVGEWMEVMVFTQENGKFSAKPVSQTSGAAPRVDSRGWWFSIAAADLDGDGDEDWVTGNLGLNYKYQASPEAPFGVHYEDFDQNGSKDIVLSYYNFGERVPLRGRSCSSEQVPMLKQEFPTYTQFASANLEEVYGLNKLNQALQYEVGSFASVWWENQGDGTFVRHELPKPAQLSPLNDLVLRDFNGDGQVDILGAGNLYVSEIETPRADAGVGCLLLGDGNGDFRSVSARDSGWFVPYDVRQIVPLDKQKILVAPNNDQLRIFTLEVR